MFSMQNISKIQQFFARAIGVRSEARAVAAQAAVTGGAMNYAAQSTVQTAREKAQQDRRDFLLGHSHHDATQVGAVPSMHMEASGHGHQGPKLHRRSSKKGHGQGKGEPHGEHKQTNEDGPAGPLSTAEADLFEDGLL